MLYGPTLEIQLSVKEPQNGYHDCIAYAHHQARIQQLQSRNFLPRSVFA